MKEQLVSFETAKLAKDKGFKEPCYNNWDGYVEGKPKLNKQFSNGEPLNFNKDYDHGGMGVYYNAPTQSLLQKWLRENHEIYVTALPYRSREAEVEFCFYYSIVQNSEELDNISCDGNDLGASLHNFNTYEDAVEEGLKEALKLIP